MPNEPGVGEPRVRGWRKKDDEWMNSKPGNDQEKTHDEALRSDSNYRSLEEKRKKASDALHDDNRITIRRDHIVTDLLSAYQRPRYNNQAFAC